jgi:hypothetical protein
MNLLCSEYHDLIHQRNRPFAMINAQDGKLLLSYVDEDTSKLNRSVRPFPCTYLRKLNVTHSFRHS